MNSRSRCAASTMERFIAAAMKRGGGRMLAWMPSPSLVICGHEHDLVVGRSSPSAVNEFCIGHNFELVLFPARPHVQRRCHKAVRIP